MPQDRDGRTTLKQNPRRNAEELEQATVPLEDAREKAVACARGLDAALAENQALKAALKEERALLSQRVVAAEEVRSTFAAVSAREHARQAETETLQITLEESQVAAKELEAANAALASANRGLEATVAVRTAELNETNKELRHGEERLRVILDSAADYAIFAMDLNRSVVSWNAGAERLLGWTASDILGQQADLIFTPEDQAAGAPEGEAGRALSEGQAKDERWHQRKDGSRFWGCGLMLPLHDSTVSRGKSPLGLLKVLRDQTQRRQAEDALREGEIRWRGVFEHMHEGFALCEMVANPEGEATDFRFLEVNDAWERLTGISAAATVGRLAREVFPGIENFWISIYRQVVETGKPVHVEHSLGPSHQWFEVLAYRTEPGRFAALFLNVTERRAAEGRRALLVHELNHRVKNTLAVVQSIAAQTARGATDLPGFSAAFQARLLVLASAHDLLTRADWEGAALKDVVKAGLDPLVLDDARVDLSGCAAGIVLPPAEALALTMAVHELATNALKYGALSVAEGRVSIICRSINAGDPVSVVEWVERGGPPIYGPPARRGFGLRLLGRGLTAAAGMAADLRFEPEGLRCTLQLSQTPNPS